MNATAKLAMIVVAGILLVCVSGKHLLANSTQAEYVRALQQRPYTERNLADEYGLELYREPAGRGGPLDYMGVASGAVKRNNALAVEAARVQLEFEERTGVAGLVLSILSDDVRVDFDRIARQRFEDQGLLPKQAAVKSP